MSIDYDIVCSPDFDEKKARELIRQMGLSAPIEGLLLRDFYFAIDQHRATPTEAFNYMFIQAEKTTQAYDAIKAREAQKNGL